MKMTELINKEKDSLTKVLQLLDKGEITLAEYVDMLHLLPAWITEKLRLLPNKRLDSKLSNLHFQLSELLSGRALDIEDHYLNLGVPKADITYQGKDKLIVVDITTSDDDDLLEYKRQELELQAAGLYECAVLTVPKSVKFVVSHKDAMSCDLLDDFNKVLVTASSEDIYALQSVLEENVLPDIKGMITSLALKDSIIKKKTGTISSTLSFHPTTWEFQQELEDEFLSKLDYVTCDPSAGDFEIPVSTGVIKSYPSLAEIWTMSDDPVVLAGLIACSVELEPEVIYKVARYDTIADFVILDYPQGAASIKKFKKKKDKSPAQIQAEEYSSPTLLLLVSRDKSISPYGLAYPKFMSVACSTHWKHYGSEYLTGKPGVKKDRLQKLTKDILKLSQTKHEKFVSTLKQQIDMTPEVISHLQLVADKSGELGVVNMMFRGVEENHKLITRSVLMHYVSQLKSLSQTICQTSPVNHSVFNFRIAQSTDGCHMLFVSTSKSIERITDVAYASWCPNYINIDLPIRTRTVSSRKLVWWHKLPAALLLKMASYAQLNMSIPSGKRYYGLAELVEYMSFHLDTRQQDSLLFGQTRPTFAAALSPLPSKDGALGKLKGIHLKGFNSIIYYARLAHTHCNLYLRKLGMTPKIELKHGQSPDIAFPSSTKSPLNMNEFIDSMFESRVFNKIKDNTLSSEAVDWLGLLENEVEYAKEKTKGTLDKLGMSPECLKLIQACVTTSSIRPLINDINLSNSVWKDSAINWWTSTTHVDGSGFSWNSAGMYTIGLIKTQGKRLVDMSNDFTSPMSVLYDTPISEFLSGSGATIGAVPTQDTQTCRKPTAILELVSQLFGVVKNPRQLGAVILQETNSFMDRNLNALSLSLWVMKNKGSMRLISRTVDKDQAEGWREFSPMNAVGIISCRATEIPMSVISHLYPIDRMNDPHAEVTLQQKVSALGDSTSLYAAADCSRFGPKQEMSSLRCMIACLSASSIVSDPIEQLVYYNLLAESTRLMGNKVTKMPSNLYSFFKEQGGYMNVLQHNAGSVYGKIASISLNLMKTSFVEPYFTQEWGMLQGTISMASSLKSSLIHELICDVLRGVYCEDAWAMVTNDDSLLVAKNVKHNMTMDQLSLFIQSLLKYGLALAAQKLNPFKTIVSTMLAEFHSMFADTNGLIIPQFKLCLAAVDVGSGDNIVEDMRMPVKSAITALRHGCTYFMALALAHVIQLLICSQHSRLKWLSENGAGLSMLGQPQKIDVIKELFIPNASDLSLLANKSSAAAVIIASQQYAIDAEEVFQYRSAYITKVSRIAYRESRSLKETNWIRQDLSLPMTARTNMASLFSAVNNGVYANRFDKSKEHYLVRLAKGLSSNKKNNIALPEGSFLRSILGDRTSVDIMNSVPIETLESEAIKFSRSHAYVVPIIKYYDMFVPIMSKLSELPPLHNIRIKKVLNPMDTYTSKNAIVKSVVPTNRYKGFEALALLHGSEKLVSTLKLELRGIYKKPIEQSLIDEASNIRAAGSLVTRLSKHAQGPFVVQDTKSAVINTKDLIMSIVKNYVPNAALDPKPFEHILNEVQDLVPSRFEVAPSMILTGALSANKTESIVETKHQLYDLLRLSEKGWYALPSGVYVKVAKLRPIRGYRLSDSYVVTTKINNTYNHDFISEADILHLGMIDNFKSYFSTTYSLHKGTTYKIDNASAWRKEVDIFRFHDVSRLLPMIERLSDGGSYLHSGELVIPISREPWSHGQEQLVSNENNGTWQDVVYVLSMSNINYNSSRMKQIEKMDVSDMRSIFRMISLEFQTSDQYDALLSGKTYKYNRMDSAFLNRSHRAAWYLKNYVPPVQSDIQDVNMVFDLLDSDSDVELGAEEVYNGSEHEYIHADNMIEVLASLTESGFFGGSDVTMLHGDLRGID